MDVALPEEIDEAAAFAVTSVGGTSLRAAVSRLALSGRPPRPLLMRIACSLSLSESVRVQSRPIIPKRTMSSLPQSVSGTMYKSIRSQIPIQISTPETIETDASSTARGSK